MNPNAQAGSKPDALPERILTKLKTVAEETATAISASENGHINLLTRPIRFQVTGISIGPDLIEDAERSAFHAFVAKLRGIPDYPAPTIVKRGSEFLLGNEDLARYIVGEFRPIIWNKTDQTHYSRIHGMLYPMMNRTAPGDGPQISIIGEDEQDSTELFKREFAARRRILDQLIQKLDFDYLYNGILQHSDARFSERFSADLHSGELAYVFLKHAHCLTYIKQCLQLHEVCASLFWMPGYPKRGGL